MKKLGRPPLAPNEPSVSVSVRIPLSQYDRLYKYADRERLSIAESVRVAISHGVSTPDFRTEK